MTTLHIKHLAAQRIRGGNPLLTANDVVTLPAPAPDSPIVRLVDGNGRFVAQAILGEQHRGIGWVFSWDEHEVFDTDWLVACLTAALARREQLLNDEQTTAYRLFHGEADGLGGLTIDCYAHRYMVVSWYNTGIYHFSPQVLAAMQVVYPQMLAVYEKCRFDGPNAVVSRLLWGDTAPEPLVVREHGVAYATYLDEGPMTGIFCDQRDVRGHLLATAGGERVLNTFSYTGAFSVAAALGGASQTTSVDVAKRSREKTAEQFALNGIPMTTHRVYVMDTFAYFAYAARHQEQFDTIILDPPSFARTKKRTFRVVKDYGALLQAAIALLAPGGRVIVSTNAANWPREEVVQMIDQAFKQAGKAYRIAQQFHLPSDFPTLQPLAETDYLKVYSCRLT